MMRAASIPPTRGRARKADGVALASFIQNLSPLSCMRSHITPNTREHTRLCLLFSDMRRCEPAPEWLRLCALTCSSSEVHPAVYAIITHSFSPKAEILNLHLHSSVLFRPWRVLCKMSTATSTANQHPQERAEAAVAAHAAPQPLLLSNLTLPNILCPSSSGPYIDLHCPYPAIWRSNVHWAVRWFQRLRGFLKPPFSVLFGPLPQCHTGRRAQPARPTKLSHARNARVLSPTFSEIHFRGLHSLHMWD